MVEMVGAYAPLIAHRGFEYLRPLGFDAVIGRA
jgi:hypothetical protein